MEVSFKNEVRNLYLGDGETFRGEGILAVTKALLQSGVAYVGGYQGAPVSHLLDVMVQAKDLLDDLGVHLETCTNEASAAAMLGASIGYPLRGAVTWKSIVGTNVASDALSNLASAGVTGGTLIILGEDYGEGASVIQERSHAFALKSGMWLLDPRPNLPTIVDLVEKAFELSEASNTPVMMELRIRACHMFGAFKAKANARPRYSVRDRLPGPHDFNYDRLSHPPATFVQEQDKVKRRLPAARQFIVDHRLNELMAGDLEDVGIIVQGGLYNTLITRLNQLGFADPFGNSRIPMLVLNVTHPLVPNQIVDFCLGKKSVLVIEEGSPEFIEQAIQTELRRRDVQTRIYGKDVLPQAGEYTAEVLEAGLLDFFDRTGLRDGVASLTLPVVEAARSVAVEILGPELPLRPATFCTGCPERPVFSALKLLKREIGPMHISADIGCHALATFAPFDSGHTILGYGMSLASAAAVAGTHAKRPISIMGDGGFWHNGVISGVASSVFNQGDSVLLIMNNGYSSATGVQSIPSSAKGYAKKSDFSQLNIPDTLRSLGVRWIRSVRSYSVETMLSTLREAMTTKEGGLKVVIADGECQLARQRRKRGEDKRKLDAGERVVRTRFGIDDDVCTGDHSCIRLSGCPSLTIKPTTDPLRTDPIAHVNNDCVGCGLCGEVSHAAQLCPSFYQADIIFNPTRWDRVKAALRQAVIRLLMPRANEATTPA